jgi:GTPase SAR1 family protein
MPFGEIVCGAPGSGKSTYCHGKHQLLSALGRPVAVVNLDPANDALPYPCAIDVSELVTLHDAMDAHALGPNGAMLFCLEHLEANFDWLADRLDALDKDTYVLFDLPGQVELSTSHGSVRAIVRRLGARGFRVRPPLAPAPGARRRRRPSSRPYTCATRTT